MAIEKLVGEEQVEVVVPSPEQRRDALIQAYLNYPESYAEYAEAQGRSIGEFPTEENKTDLLRILFPSECQVREDERTYFATVVFDNPDAFAVLTYLDVASSYGIPGHFATSKTKGYCRADHFFTHGVKVSKVSGLLRHMIAESRLTSITGFFPNRVQGLGPENQSLYPPPCGPDEGFTDPLAGRYPDQWTYMLQIVSQEALDKKEGMVTPEWIDEVMEINDIPEDRSVYGEESTSENDTAIDELLADFKRELQKSIVTERDAVADEPEEPDDSNDFSEEDVRLFYRRLAHQRYGLTELVVIKPGKGILATGFFDDEDAFAEACRRWNSRGNVYAGRNPVPPDFPAKHVLEVNETHANRLIRAADRDIEWVTAMSLDIDPVRPEGASSTRAQRRAALRLAEKIAGSEGGSIDDSGNGAYVWIPIKPIKVTIDNRHVIKAQCRAWEDRIRHKYQPESSGLRIDSVHDLSRVKKVIGTLSVKGDTHRRSRFYTEPLMEPHPSLDQTILGTALEADSPENVEIEVQNQLPETFQELLETDEELRRHWETPHSTNDSSLHDWRLGAICINRGITNPNELATILAQSPHGKTASGHANEPYLSITVSRLIERLGRKQAAEDVREKIVEIRKDPEIKGKKQEIAELVYRDLQSRGTFIRSGRKLYYFPRDEKKLMKIDDESLDFIALLCDLYGLVETEPDCKYFLAFAKANCHRHGEQVEIYRYVHYDKANFKLYVDRFDTKMYVLDGSSIALHNNGADGVLFETDELAQPYQIHDPGDGDLFDRLIVQRVNFESGADMSLEVCEQQLLFRVWIWSIFFELPTNPLLLLYGPKGSGKTAVSKMAGKLFFGGKFDVSSVTDDQRDFDALISNRFLIVLDNLDAYKTWLNDRLAKLATGQAIEKRELYTTNSLAVFFPKSRAIITARTPKFRQDDVADRTLVLNVERFEQFIPENILIDEVLANRNQILSGFFWQLNRCIQKLKENQDKRYAGNFRMADFADFGYRIFDGSSTFLSILDKMKQAQSKYESENDSFVDLMEEWVDSPGNSGREVAAKELFQELKSIADMSGIKLWYTSPRALSMKIHHQVSSLEQHFNVEIIKRQRGGNLYRFEKKEESE